MAGLICSLDVRIAYVDQNGALTGGYIGLLNPVTFTLEQPEPERIIRQSNMRDSYGQALDTVIRPNPATFTLGTDEAGDAQVLAWALSGSVVAYAQSAATVTDEDITVVSGKWVQLPHRAISALTVTSVDEADTYVLNTDYLVDAISGMVFITEAGDIASGTVRFNYSAAALTGERIEGGTTPSISVRIDGEGKNEATGEPIHVVIPRAVLSASGGLNLISSEFNAIELSGNPVKLTGQPLMTLDKPRAA